jgi:hypothetical protein
MSLYLDVTAAADGGAIKGVEATLSGPTTVRFSCEAGANGYPVTACFPDTETGDVPTPGTYSVHVSAPGFQSADVSATVTLVPDTRCGCDALKLNPAQVILSPAPERQDAAAP